MKKHKEITPITTKNGNFYKAGIVIPTAFGDQEQIVALKESQRISDLLGGEGLEICDLKTTIKINIKTEFKCSCLTLVTIEEEHLENDDSIHVSTALLEDVTVSCYNCKKKYVVKERTYGLAVCLD